MTTAALSLPGLLDRRLDAAARELLFPADGPGFDFSSPPGEPALVGADSVSWRLFKNPLTLFIGGVTAVILELAEPRVRHGVWDHSSFRTDPVRRLQRTGLAAMITVYGARSGAEAMIAGVGRRHGRIEGRTDAGIAYRADDVELLDWVQATASFGFTEAFNRFGRPLTPAEFDRAYAEAAPAARLYGALNAPADRAAMQALFAAMAPKLEASPVILEFLDIMRRAPVGPPAARPAQRLLVRAAIDLVPPPIREQLGLGPELGLRPWEAPLVRSAGALADRVMLKSSPAVQAALRLGLPADHLWR
jgi:uncharacterized protein (DUF2236 family)